MTDPFPVFLPLPQEAAMMQAVTATRTRQTAARAAKETRNGDSEAELRNSAASRSAEMEISLIRP